MQFNKHLFNTLQGFIAGPVSARHCVEPAKASICSQVERLQCSSMRGLQTTASESLSRKIKTPELEVCNSQLRPNLVYHLFLSIKLYWNTATFILL